MVWDTWDHHLTKNLQGTMTQCPKIVLKTSPGWDKPGTRQNLQGTMTQCPKKVLKMSPGLTGNYKKIPRERDILRILRISQMKVLRVA